jgi:hypothetical protein
LSTGKSTFLKNAAPDPFAPKSSGPGFTGSFGALGTTIRALTEKENRSATTDDMIFNHVGFSIATKGTRIVN